MIRALLVALALAGGAAARAEIPVRGGEHEGFTRLAIPLPKAGGWSILPTGEGWEVLVEGGGAFDLADTWSRIGRTRIAAVASGGEGRLTLVAGCECDLAATEHPGPILALDVGPEVAAVERPPLGAAPEERGPALPEAGAGVLPLLPRFEALRVPATAPADPPRREIEPDPLRAALAGALSIGVDRGLLDPAADPPPLPERIERLETGGTLRLDPRAAPPPVPASCPEAGAPALAARAAPAPLFGEFDRVDPAAALDMARRHLANGLPEEARAVLRLVPEGPERGELFAVAAALTDRTPPGWAACAPPAAFWQAVAGEVPVPPPGEIASAALAVPPRLAAIAVPPAARTLMEAGPDGARAARRMLRMLPEADREPPALLAAALLEEGEAGLDALRPLALGTSPEAVEAAASYLRGRPADAAVADAALRLAQDRPGDPLRRALLEVAVPAALAQGRPDAALEVLEPRDPPLAWAAIARHLADAPTAEAVRLSRQWADVLEEAPIHPDLWARIERRLVADGWGPADASIPAAPAMPAPEVAPAEAAWAPGAPPAAPAPPPGDAAEAARVAVESADRALAAVRAVLEGR